MSRSNAHNDNLGFIQRTFSFTQTCFFSLLLSWLISEAPNNPCNYSPTADHLELGICSLFLEMYLHCVFCTLLSLVLNHYMWEVLTRELPFQSDYIIVYILLQMSVISVQSARSATHITAYTPKSRELKCTSGSHKIKGKWCRNSGCKRGKGTDVRILFWEGGGWGGRKLFPFESWSKVGSGRRKWLGVSYKYVCCPIKKCLRFWKDS